MPMMTGDSSSSSNGVVVVHTAVRVRRVLSDRWLGRFGSLSLESRTLLLLSAWSTSVVLRELASLSVSIGRALSRCKESYGDELA